MRAGYKSVCLEMNKCEKHIKIHRLVAMTFIPNDDPENKLCVNHIDGDKMNNTVENLEWLSYRDNNIHAFETGLNVPLKRAVICYDPETGEHKEYESIRQAANELGLNCRSISAVCAGNFRQTGGYQWKYVEENPNIVQDVDLSEYKQIDGFPNYVINKEGKIYSLPYNRFLKYQNHKESGKQVQLTNNNNKKTILVHRLTGCYFLKKTDPDHNSIRHIDGDKANNHVSNLKWVRVGGVEMPDIKYDIPYYNPKKCVKRPKRANDKIIKKISTKKLTLTLEKTKNNTVKNNKKKIIEV